jgi:tRNA threonylcarbamoyladenosine biosynthesis protein TsaB
MQPNIIIIDTALENATVSIANGNQVLAVANNTQPNSHAGFVHTAIQQLLQQQQISLQEIKAIAVVNGPGSYTGIRVGVASAKGLCFALQIPLITISSLHALAVAAANVQKASFYIPIIDARRMEVFTAVYNNALQLVEPSFATVLQQEVFSKYWQQQPIVFMGNAISKAATVLQHPHIIYSTANYNTTTLAQLAYESYTQQQFADIAYAEPLYAKPFYDTKKS